MLLKSFQFVSSRRAAFFLFNFDTFKRKKTQKFAGILPFRSVYLGLESLQNPWERVRRKNKFQMSNGCFVITQETYQPVTFRLWLSCCFDASRRLNMSRDPIGITCRAEETVASFFCCCCCCWEYFYSLIWRCVRTEAALEFNCSHVWV